ncbi:hypothetical protein D7Y06_24885 [Roseburia sp. 1XD42-69]|nr:hypothetical protein D7Y06_24885 [Roseburia sp. 1XD42-69]
MDKVFQNNVDRYEECGLCLTYRCGLYTEYGITNMNRMQGNSRQSLGNNQSVQKLKDQNSMSGTGGGNAGSGGGASSNGTGGQAQVGLQFGLKNENSYGKTSGKYDSTAEFLTNIANRKGKFYADKATIDKIGKIEAKGEDFSLLYKKIMSSRPFNEGGSSIAYKYGGEFGTKYLIHEVTDARGYIIYRDFDAVRISSEQLINKRH